MNPLLERQSPFFESMNKSIDAIVPLAMEKYKIDEQTARWKDQLAEATRSHNINLGTNLYSHFLQTGDQGSLATARKLLTTALGDQTPIELSGTLPPAVQLASEKVQRMGPYKQDVSALGEQPDAEKVLGLYMKHFPEDVANITKMRHEIESDKQLADLRKAQTKWYNARPDIEMTKANKVGAGHTPAQIKTFEYFRDLYGDEFAQRMLTKVKDPGEAKIWNQTFQASISNFEAPALATQKADNTVAAYRQRFPATPGRKGGAASGGGAGAVRDITPAVTWLKGASNRGKAVEMIGALADQGWTEAELNQIAKQAGWDK